MSTALRSRARHVVIRALTSPDERSSPPALRSRVPFVGAGLALFIDPIGFQRAGHEELGEVFSTSLFGMPLTFVGGRDALARFAGAADEELDLIGAYKRLVGRLLGEDIFAPIAPEVLRALSGVSVRRESGPLAEFTTDWLQDRLGSGGEVDGLALANDLILHMSCRFVCGSAIGRRERDELAKLFHVLESDFSVLGMFLPIETPSMKRRKAAQARILAIFEDEVRRASREGADPEGYLAAVLRTHGTDMRTAALAIMGAVFGAHTNTAMTFACSLGDLLAHPRVLESVREEQASALAGQPLDLSAFSKMPGLLRAINESMRLHANGGLWRLTRAPFEIGGYTIPENTLVGTSMGLVNGDASAYPDPDRYDPDRYREMKTDDWESPPVKEKRFGAFGLGRHVCPGRGLAYVMVATAITTLLRDYDVALEERPSRWFDLMTAGLARPVGRLRLRVSRRA